MPATGKLDRKALLRMGRMRLQDARILARNKRYDGAMYLCGYAVEFALKARICLALKWVEYLTSEDFRSFKTHKLASLLVLSGCEMEIKTKFGTEWSAVERWNPEARYDPMIRATAKAARLMIQSTETLLGAL